MPAHLLPAGATPDEIKIAVSNLEQLGQTVVATEPIEAGLLVFTAFRGDGIERRGDA